MFMPSKHDDQDDDKNNYYYNEHIDIRQFFTHQNFPNPDLSKFTPSKFCAIR